MIVFQKSKRIISFKKNFVLKRLSANKVKKIIKSLSKKKERSAISSSIPVSNLIDTMDIYLPLSTYIIKDSLKRAIFPDEIKLPEVIALFKIADPFDKTNYRLVSILSHISKDFERIICNQID